MKQRLLVLYQLFTGVSDTATGLLLLIVPAFTLHLMRLHAPPDAALVYLSYMGAFVLSVGAACLYGAWLAARPATSAKLEVVWLLTAITRGVVVIFVTTKVLSGSLEMGWITVALSDGLYAVLQIVGLTRGWLGDAAA